MTQEHIEHHLLKDFAVDPDHADRKESAEFRRSKRRLKVDGHYKCYVCGSTEKIQIHHRAGEYMFNNVVDYQKLKDFCEEWDIFGYGRLLKNKPITTVDDIRNQMPLCQAHHTGIDHEDGGGGTGIHSLTFNSWIMQKLALEGANPIPQQGETFAAAMDRVKKYERKEAPNNA